VDNFETAIPRKDRKNGVIVVAFSFTKGASEEAARAKSVLGFNISLRTVQEILNGS
jgi:hypothetical protein